MLSLCCQTSSAVARFRWKVPTPPRSIPIPKLPPNPQMMLHFLESNTRNINEIIGAKDPVLAKAVTDHFGESGLSAQMIEKEVFQNFVQSFYPEVKLSVSTSANDIDISSISLLSRFKESAARSSKFYDSQAGIAILPPRLDSAAIISMLPTDVREYRKVFSRVASQGDQSDLRAGASLRAHPQSKDFTKLVAIRSNALSEVKAEVLIFVGHNDGGALVNVNGARLKIRDIARECVVAAKLCIFLSCNSEVLLGQANSIGVATKLSLKKAVLLAELQARIVAEPRHYDVKFELLSRTIQTEQNGKQQRKLLVIQTMSEVIIIALVADEEP